MDESIVGVILERLKEEIHNLRIGGIDEDFVCDEHVRNRIPYFEDKKEDFRQCLQQMQDGGLLAIQKSREDWVIGITDKGVGWLFSSQRAMINIGHTDVAAYGRLLNPLKVRFFRQLISLKDVEQELRRMVTDERYPAAFRTRVSEELAPFNPPTNKDDSTTLALREALRQEFWETRGGGMSLIFDRITETPGMRDYHAAKRHEERVQQLAKSRQPQKTEASDKEVHMISQTSGSVDPNSNDPIEASDHSASSSASRQRRDANLNATYRRFQGRDGHGAHKQEQLIEDARAWAEAELNLLVAQTNDTHKLKTLIVKKTWDDFLPKHSSYLHFQLGYRAFAAALWDEGGPSLADLAESATQRNLEPADAERLDNLGNAAEPVESYAEPVSELTDKSAPSSELADPLTEPSDTSNRVPKEIIDQCRLNQGIRSYEKFASRIGIGKDTLYAITKETRWLSDQTYQLVAKFCNCNPEDLHPSGLPRRKSD